MSPHFPLNTAYLHPFTYNMPILPLSHTLPLTTVKRARLSRSSIRNILLALDIGDSCRQSIPTVWDIMCACIDYIV